MKRGSHLLFIGLLFCIPALVYGQTVGGVVEKETSLPTPIALQLQPAVVFPLGDSTSWFDNGVFCQLGGEYGLHNEPLIFLSGTVDYSLAPIQAEDSLSIISAGAGGGIYLDFTPRISFKASLNGGAYYGFFNGGGEAESEVRPVVSVGAGFSMIMTPAISLNTEASYRNFIGLQQAFGVSLGTSFYLRGRELREMKLATSLSRGGDELRNARTPEPGEGIRIQNINFVPVFPVFHKYYDDHALGTIALENQESFPVSDVKVSLFMKQYMDAPKECNEPFELAGGEAREIDLLALFSDRLLEITEATKVATEITLSYRMKGRWYQETRSESVRVYDRNAMTWDDDRRAAAFVTAKDPVVLALAKAMAGMAREEGNRAVNGNLLTAMGIHKALELIGMQYTVDPKTPYTEFSKTSGQTDYLQFPRQTLGYRAGDCDDLSILYSALLEAVGVETAFITVPGHIFMAFNTGLASEEAEKLFSKPGDLVFQNETAWIPVEATEYGKGFLAAWQLGAKQWREHSLKEQAGFFPVHEAWEQYEPVGLPGTGEVIAPPPQEQVLTAFRDEQNRFIEREIYDRVEALQNEIRRSGGDARSRNRLGVLYARYGLYDKAETELKKIQTAYSPALVNLAHIAFLREEWMKALDYYERAQRLNANNATAQLGIARVHHELENYGLVKMYFDKIKVSDPKLAQRFAYLDLRGEEGSRAAEISEMKGVVQWMDE